MSDAATDLFAQVQACPACAAWDADHKTGAYVSNCRDCKARAIARSPAAWRALRGESDVEVRAAIERNFGADNYREARKLVWAWIQKLKGPTT